MFDKQVNTAYPLAFIDTNSLITACPNHSFDRLPEELIFLTLNFVPKEEWNQIQCINKLWYQIFNQKVRLLKLEDPSFSTEKKKCIAKVLGEVVKKLNFFLGDIHDQDLIDFVKVCPNLQFINLEGCSRITDEGIQFLGEHCQKLQYINLEECSNVTDKGLEFIAMNCRDLRFINLSKCEITEKSLQLLSENCHDLKSINLAWCDYCYSDGKGFGESKISDQLIISFGKHCPNLHSLDLTGFNSTDEKLRVIAENCRALRSINLYSNGLITDKGLEFFAEHCPNLISINLVGCWNLTARGILSISKHCFNLQTIELERYFDMDNYREGPDLTDEDILQFVIGCPALRTIHFEGYSFTTIGLEHIATHCDKLRFINITGPNITTDDIQSLFDRYHNLQQWKDPNEIIIQY